MSYNEIQRLQQLAGIITEVKVFDPVLNKKTLPNLIQLKKDNGVEFVDINPEIIYNLVEENPGLFGIRGDKSSVFRFVKNLSEKIYDTWEYDDYEKYKNITVGQLIDFIKSNDINEIKINEPLRKIVFPILIKNEKDWWRFIRNRFTPIYQKNDYNQKEKYLEKFLDDVDQYSFPRKPSFPFYVTNNGISSKLVKKIK